MVPSPAVVTINSELQFLQKYLFPDSLANEILPKHGLFVIIIAIGLEMVNRSYRK